MPFGIQFRRGVPIVNVAIQTFRKLISIVLGVKPMPIATAAWTKTAAATSEALMDPWVSDEDAEPIRGLRS